MKAEREIVPPGFCPNCDTPETLEFCPKCGQKRPHHHEYALGHFFHELFHEIFHVDGKIVRTLRTMVAEPGQVTLDYWEGRRARYLTPIRIYLLATAAFFALVKFTGSLQGSEIAGSMPAMAGLASRFPAELIEGRFQLFYKVFMVFSVAGLALLFRWLLVGRPYGAYLIAAVHTVSVLFVLTLIGQKVEEGLHRIAGLPTGWLTLVLLVFAYWPYLAVSMKRWTGQGWGWVAGRLALIIGATIATDGVVYLAAIGATLASFPRALP